MTIGIYALYWEEPDLVYVGLSSNIENRFRAHKQTMCSLTHSNTKVQSTYIRYGLPHFFILEKCEIQDLELKEKVWTEEFDSLNPKYGLNITSPGSFGGSGTYGSRSEYTRLQILLAFRQVSSSKYKTAKEIQDQTGVGKDTVTAICAGIGHTWLKVEFPYRYSLMCIRRAERNTVVNIKNKLLWNIELISPTLQTVVCTNITKFAAENGLDQGHLSKVINGKRNSHKGWKLKRINT